VVDTTAIPPGGEGQIAVTLDTHGKNGKLDKSISIISNDPVNTTASIHVLATIELDFDFESANMYLGRLDVDSQVTRSAFIQVKDIKEIEIGEITTSTPLLSARSLGFTQVEGQGSRLEIEITAGPGFPPGEFHGTIKVRSNLTRKPEAELRVWAQVPTGVEVVPSSLNYRIRSAATSERDRIKLIHISNFAKNLPLKILDTRDLDGNLELKLRTVEEGKEYELTATVKEGEIPKEGRCSGRIQIMTNNPEYKELIVAYSAVWQE